MVQDAAVWAAVLLGASFAVLGAVVVAGPGRAARMYGIPVGPRDREALSWARAAGWRDLAVGVMVLAAATAEATTLGAVLLGSVLVPVGDVAVLLRHGIRRARTLAPHAASAAVMALVGLVLVLD